jgi:alpha-beta hydrolase superfamily lysophospholipase
VTLSIHKVIQRQRQLERQGDLQPSVSNKLFLLGSSLGGHVCIRYFIERNEQLRREEGVGVDGVCLLSPLIRVNSASRPSVLLEKVAQVLHLLCPQLPITKAARGKGTRYLALMAQLREDRLYYNGRLRIHTGLSIRDSIDAYFTQLHRLTVPLRVDIGDEDEVVCPESCHHFISACASKDKEIVVHKGGDHSLLRGWAAGKEVMDGVIKWVLARSRPPG